MPPIMTSEQRARSVQASPAQKPYPRGFVAAVPTSPAPLSPLSPPALQPPPPSHYFRNRNRSSEDSALFRKRSEIYTRVQRVLPPALHAEDSASGLLFGSDFHADWSNSQFGRPPLSSPRFVVAVPIHAAHTPAAPPSAQPPSVSVQSNSNLYNMPLSRDEDDDTPEVSSSVPSHASNKERPSRRPLRALLRERLTVKVRSRSVEAASATQPTASTDDLPRYSTELGLSFNQQCALVWPPSPGSSASSAAYEPSFWGSEVDSDKKSVSSSASQSLKGAPPTPPSPTHINLRTPPPSAPISLLEAQKVRRAKAFDQFTRYSETTPFQFQRGMPNNMHAAPVPVPTPVLALHSAREIPTEAPVQMQWATEMHRVSSAPNLKHQFHRQPHSQSQLHSQQLVVPLVAPQFTASPPPALASPLLPLPSHAPATMNATTTSSTTATTTAPEGKHHRPSGHRKSTGVIPGVGSLKAMLRPRAHSKAAATGAH